MTNPDGPAPGSPLPAASAEVRYRERASQFPVLGGLIGAFLVADSIVGLVLAGGPNGRGPGPALSFLVVVAFVGAVYLILVIIDLANGIEIASGRFAIGARGVPAAGRLWRQISGPLAAVRSWEVLTPEQVRGLGLARRAELRSGGRRLYLGDLRMFGRRRVLRLIIDPAAATARLPSRVLVGYLFVKVARAGGVWDGCILIGTRRPAALTAALEQALPGRRARAGAAPAGQR